MFPIVFPKGMKWPPETSPGAIFAGSPESVLVEQNVARETERNLCDWCDSGPVIIQYHNDAGLPTHSEPRWLSTTRQA
jgi:hypothetical protein